jgi:hypothetical protein
MSLNVENEIRLTFYVCALPVPSVIEISEVVLEVKHADRQTDTT